MQVTIGRLEVRAAAARRRRAPRTEQPSHEPRRLPGSARRRRRAMSNALAIAAVTRHAAPADREGPRSRRRRHRRVSAAARPRRAGQRPAQPRQPVPLSDDAQRRVAEHGPAAPGAPGRDRAAAASPRSVTTSSPPTREGDDEVRSHRFLGRAMSVLHDHPLLGADGDRAARSPESELHDQVERIRSRLSRCSVEEMSKLWSGFQTQYRLSVAYQVSVVLIESTRPARRPCRC